MLLPQVVMNHHNTPLLREYCPFDPRVYEGKPITSRRDKAMYVVSGGAKRLIPDYDTFQAMNFTNADIVDFHNLTEFSSFPDGPTLPALDYPGRRRMSVKALTGHKRALKGAVDPTTWRQQWQH